MRKIQVLAAMAAVAVWVILGSTAPGHAEKRVALLVGNNAYQNVPTLRTAINDAHALGATLKKLGFQVFVTENQSRRAMSEALLAFDRAIEPGDVAFFFFAGHGFEIRGDNYLLPIDVPAATEGQEELVRDAAFGAHDIVGRLQARGARTAILVLDACRNNPFERPGTRAVGGGGGLAPMSPPEGVFVIFSAGAKQTALDALADDDRNPNSVFTRIFTRQLGEPGLSLVQIAKRTQVEVKRQAGSVRHEQTPAYYDEIVGDVVLNGTAADAPVAQAAPQVAALSPAAAPARPEPREAAVAPTNGPLANFMRHNGGWTVSFSFLDPTTAISWRLGEAGSFKETGFLDTLDTRTRRRMPNPSIELDADTPAGTIYVRYVDQHGDMVGPFPVRFEPAEALEHGERKILEMTAGSWLAFREFNGLLLYYTHLVSYRCAIREVRIGIETSVPGRRIELPPCDQKDPNAIPANVQPYIKLPPSTHAVSVELTYRDGSVSEVKTFRR